MLPSALTKLRARAVCYVYFSMAITFAMYASCEGIRNCITPVSLLEGRRSITGATLTASSERSGNSASMATLSNDDGWCSTGQPRTTVPSIYLQVNLHTDVLISAVVTEGFSGFLGISTYFTQQYKIQIAGSNGDLRFVAAPTDSSVAAIFPQNILLIQSEIRRTEELPTTVLGQVLRLLPTTYNDEEHACTKLELMGCLLLECRIISSIADFSGVLASANGIGVSHDDLFTFEDESFIYCAPTTSGSPITITITFPEELILLEIDIRGNDRTFPFSNQFVTSFSLSYEHNGTFVQYIQDTDPVEFTVLDEEEHFFGLWPPISTSSIQLIIHDWESEPCISLSILGCRGSEGVHHSNDPNTGLITDHSSSTISPSATIAMAATTASSASDQLLVTDHSSSTINTLATITRSMTVFSATPTSKNMTGSTSGFEIPPLAKYIGAGVGGLIIWIIIGVCLLCICNKKDLPCCSDKEYKASFCHCFVCDSTGISFEKPWKFDGCGGCIDACLKGCGDCCTQCYKDACSCPNNSWKNC